MHDMWWMISTLILMMGLSIVDIKQRLVPIWGIILIVLVSIIHVLIDTSYTWFDIGLSCVPGLLFVGIALLTRGKMGIGDGLVTVAIGIGLGIEECVYSLMIALFLNCLIAGALLAIKKVRKDTQIPFIPFLTIGMGVVGLCL